MEIRWTTRSPLYVVSDQVHRPDAKVLNELVHVLGSRALVEGDVRPVGVAAAAQVRCDYRVACGKGGDDLAPRGGKTYQIVREQSRRISRCRLTFFRRSETAEAVTNGAFVRDAILPLNPNAPEQLPLWQERVRLDEGFTNP